MIPSAELRQMSLLLDESRWLLDQIRSEFRLLAGRYDQGRVSIDAPRANVVRIEDRRAA